MPKLSYKHKIVFLIFLANNIFGQTSPHGAISIACTNCHTTESWKELISPLNFNHTETQFPLIGKHKSIACKDCHKDLKFKGIAKDCFSCHKKEFVNTQTPNHQRAQFSHDCLSCHSSNSWQPVIFQHSKTNFPLDGAHKNVDCVNCHKNEKFSGLKQDCIFCHQKDFIGVKTPNHSCLFLKKTSKS